jgi:hypothetical protein
MISHDHAKVRFHLFFSRRGSGEGRPGTATERDGGHRPGNHSPPRPAERAARDRHVLINAKTALGTGPVSPGHRKRHLPHQGVHLERIRGDRVPPEALTAGVDPLLLALVFTLSHTTASRCAVIAQNLFDGRIEQTRGNE